MKQNSVVGASIFILLLLASCEDGSEKVVIDSLSTDSGIPGDTVVVFGSGFSRFNIDLQIFWDEKVLPPITSWNDSVVFRVPFEVAPGEHLVRVVKNGNISNAVGFVVRRDAWYLESNLTGQRDGFAVVEFENYCYFVGAQSFTERYHFGLARWDSVSGLQNPRFGGGAVVSSGTLFVGQGVGTDFNGNQIGVPFLDAYNPENDQWNTVAMFPSSSIARSAFSHGRRLYFLSGTDFLIFDMDSEIWTNAPHIPNPRTGWSAVSFNNRVYVVGGEDPSGVPVAAFDAFELDTETWSEAGELPIARTSHGAIVLNGKVYLVGGYRSELLNDGPVDSWDPAENIVEPRANMRTPLLNPRLAVWNNRIYVFGNDANPVVEVYLE